MQKLLTLTAAAIILASCGNGGDADLKTKAAEAATKAAHETSASSSTKYSAATFDGAKLSAILDARPDDVKARYDARHPVTWPETFVTKSAEWMPANGPKIAATTFGSPAGDMAGSLDAILFIRALHNLSRFETEGAYLTKALSHSHALLKEGGIIGVVQHRAPEGWEDSQATGSAGYVKQSALIARFEAAGFDFDDTSVQETVVAKYRNKSGIIYLCDPTFCAI